MNAPMKFSILSSRAARSDQQVRPGGKIRAGIKVLTKTAMNNPKAVRLYEEGVAQRLKFTEIEKKIESATGIRNSMYPRNTPFFNVAASDFGMPEIASLIVQKYGEVRDDDTQPHLYRFPVVFHSDDLNEVYPNEFKRHGFEPHYESHYGDDGERYCRYLPEVTAEMAAEHRVRRIKKMPRREKVIRGLCDPGNCAEFQQGQCKFRGRLLFYIPGIPTTGMLSMETSSEYAAEAIWSDLERIRDALGTLPRMNPNNPGAPIFWITKVLEPRTYFDEHGQKKSGFQWVPKLQADIDIGALLTSGRGPMLPNASTPVAWLAAPKGMPEAAVLPVAQEVTPAAPANSVPSQRSEDDPDDQLEQVIQQMGLDQPFVMEYFDIKIAQSWENDPAHVQTAIKMLKDLARVGDVCAGKLIGMSVNMHRLGVDLKEFTLYAFAKYGKGFTSNERVLNALEDDVREFGKQSSESVIAHIRHHLTAAA